MKFSFFPLLSCLWFEFALAQPVIGLSSYVTGFSNPIDIAHCGDERLFIVEQDGLIRIIDGQGAVKPQPFLNIDDGRVLSGGERGLLGLAFHPEYQDNGYFYLNYTNSSGHTVISRFSVTANPDIASPSSELILLTINQPYANHNGGNIEFGHDGYLYIGMGDGGSGGDPQDFAQNPQSLLGKMLRIDVDTSASYKIPPSNPFVSNPGVDDRIWALGLRNPWRFSFDRLTGDLWIGDVGQNAKEEISFQPGTSTGGENYGWKCYEGNSFYAPSTYGCSASYVIPVFDFGRSLGSSVTGGYVYRGCKYPDLFGHYVFCDYGSGNFWTIENLGGGSFQTTFQNQYSSYRYVSFGEDMNGELYVAGLNGTIYRITESNAAQLPSITALPSSSFCAGDTISLNAPAGWATYDWKMNGTAAGTGQQLLVNTPGSYRLTTSGINGCVFTTSAIAVSSIAAPAPQIIPQDTEFCENDSVLITTGVFSNYQWSEGSMTSSIYASQGGAYSVTVTDANGCTGTSTAVTITENSLPTPVIQQAGYLCGINTVELSTASYASYNWSTLETTPQISVNQPGDYRVTVTDNNGCLGESLPVTVESGQLPQPAIYSSNGLSFCEGDSTELFTPITDVSYLWSTGDTTPLLTVNTSGIYAVVITDSNGCTGTSDSAFIQSNPQPQMPDIVDENGVLTTDSGYHYQWYVDGNILADDTSRTLDIAACCSCCYNEFVVEITDLNGCSSVSDTFYYNWTGISNFSEASIRIYPNPFSSEVIINYSLAHPANVTIRLFDVAGKELAKRATDMEHTGTHTVTFRSSTHKLKAGFYIITVNAGNSLSTFKVLKM